MVSPIVTAILENDTAQFGILDHKDIWEILVSSSFTEEILCYFNDKKVNMRRHARICLQKIMKGTFRSTVH